MPQTIDTIRSTILQIWQTRVGRDAENDIDLFEAGGDSIIALRILRDVESQLGVELDLEALAGAITVSSLVREAERALSMYQTVNTQQWKPL